MQINAGIDAIKRGDFAEIEESGLEDYLENLKVVRWCRHHWSTRCDSDD
jgi:hypothetical protein